MAKQTVNLERMRLAVVQDCIVQVSSSVNQVGACTNRIYVMGKSIAKVEMMKKCAIHQFVHQVALVSVHLSCVLA